MRLSPRHGVVAGLLCLAVILSQTGPAAAAPTRAWVVAALQRALDGDDLNRIASLAYPLTTGPRTGAVESVLDRTAAVLRTLDPQRLTCDDLPDLLLTAGFLAETGRAVDTGAAARRLRGCQTATGPFATANALIQVCRFGDGNHRDRVPGGLRRLLAAQRVDGGIDSGQGGDWYYLSSHAALAFHACGAPPAAIDRAAGYLRRSLAPFARRGFLDGLAESLVFLAWMDRNPPEAGRYRAFLTRRTTADGGLCFTWKPACRAHWHATSLLLELQNRAGKRP